MDNKEKREMDSIKNVLILGAGTMGLQIGLLCGAHGFDTIIYDPVASALETAVKKLPDLASSLARHGRIEKKQAESARDRIRFSSDPEDAGRSADFINESVPEDPVLKQKVFARFNEICPAHAVFTTNSSTLIPSMMAGATGRPDRFAALHFHDCLVTNVVDIMPHKGTSARTMEIIRGFCTAIDQFPIELKKEQHGYVFNTMLTELLGAALSLASKEVASVEDIDRSWMGIMKTFVGPFGIMDSIGLETVYKVTDYWAEKKGDDQGRKNAAFLKSYVDRGLLGAKTGKGFYDYPEPSFITPSFMEGIR